jgi:hypothetical protein
VYTGPYVRPGVTDVDSKMDYKKYHGTYGGTIWTDELSKECVFPLLNYRTQTPNVSFYVKGEELGIINCFLLNN